MSLPVILAASGCGVFGGKACTAMGGVSTVAVDVSAELAPVSAGLRRRAEPQASGVSVRVCLRQECRSAPVEIVPTDSPQRPRVWIPFETLPPEPVTLRVTLMREADGSALVGPAQVEVHPVAYEVNGPGCGPVVQAAGVTIDVAGLHESAGQARH